MKQQIHTFPLWESLESNSECPFCETLEETEESYISGMFRDMTVDKEFVSYLRDNSFCSKHFARLLDYKDKFGLALLLSQLLAFEIADLESADLKNNGIQTTTKTPLQKLLERFVSQAPTKSYERSTSSICPLCQYLEEREMDFMSTLIQLWKENLHFRALYYNSKGFCLQHYYSTTALAPRILEGEELDNFLDTSLRIQFQSMKELNEDLRWFIKKFNYNYLNEPWKNSRDSLARSILKIKKKKDPIN